MCLDGDQVDPLAVCLAGGRRELGVVGLPRRHVGRSPNASSLQAASSSGMMVSTAGQDGPTVRSTRTSRSAARASAALTPATQVEFPHPCWATSSRSHARRLWVTTATSDAEPRRPRPGRPRGRSRPGRPARAATSGSRRRVRCPACGTAWPRSPEAGAGGCGGRRGAGRAHDRRGTEGGSRAEQGAPVEPDDWVRSWQAFGEGGMDGRSGGGPPRRPSRGRHRARSGRRRRTPTSAHRGQSGQVGAEGAPGRARCRALPCASAGPASTGHARRRRQ